MKPWRHLVVFAGECARIIIWHGWGSEGKIYPLSRERARRIGRLLDRDATVKLIRGELVYVWNDWNWAQIAKGGR